MRPLAKTDSATAAGARHHTPRVQDRFVRFLAVETEPGGVCLQDGTAANQPLVAFTLLLQQFRESANLVAEVSLFDHRS